MNLHMPEYMSAVAAMHPRKEDPREDRIVTAVREAMFQSPWVSDAHDRASEVQLEALRSMMANLGDDDRVYAIAQHALKEFTRLFRSEVIEGGEHLAALPKDRLVFAFTN